MELHELETPCANETCLHPLKDHLDGWAESEWCDVCDCRQFLAAGDVQP